MALADCRECGGTISSEALMCPHCGAPGPSAIAGTHSVAAVASRPGETFREEVPNSATSVASAVFRHTLGDWIFFSFLFVGILLLVVFASTLPQDADALWSVLGGLMALWLWVGWGIWQFKKRAWEVLMALLALNIAIASVTLVLMVSDGRATEYDIARLFLYGGIAALGLHHFWDRRASYQR